MSSKEKRRGHRNDYVGGIACPSLHRYAGRRRAQHPGATGRDARVLQKAWLLHLHSAVDLAHAAGDRRGRAAALDRLAALYQQLGADEPAYRMLLWALETYQELADPQADQVRQLLTQIEGKAEGRQNLSARLFVFTDAATRSV